MAKNYIKGSIRSRKTSYGEEQLLASLKLEDLQKIVNERGYVNIVIDPKKATDQYGNTHHAYQNDYDPKAAAAAKQEAGTKTAKSSSPTAKAQTTLKAPNFKEDNTDDLPF